MHKPLSLSLLVVCAANLPAQAWLPGFVSPRGAEFFEGNSSSDIMLGNWAASTRTQQIDNNLVGSKLTLVRRIGFRRNGSGNAGAAKKTDLTVILSHADYATVTNVFASNYKDAAKTVFTRKQISLPDWNTPVAVVPSPFDAVVPFDIPFVYNGTDALLFDVLNDANPLGTYTQDWVSGTTPHTYGAYPVDLSAGCKTSNGTLVQRCGARANATGLSMVIEADQAPSLAPMLALLEFTDWNLPIGCGVAHAQPTLPIPIGAADAQGYLKLTTFLTLPWSANYASIPVIVQAIAVDFSQPVLPIAFANGQRCPLPATAGAGQINVKRIYHTSSSSATTGTGPSTSAVPVFVGV